jgi:competence protein ComEC
MDPMKAASPIPLLVRRFFSLEFSTLRDRGRLLAQRPMVAVLLAMIAGILLDRCFPMPLWFWFGGLVLGWFSSMISRARGGETIAVLLLLAGCLAAGASWHHLKWNIFAPDDLGVYARARKHPVCLEAELIAPPKWFPAPEPDPMRIIPADAYSVVVLRAQRIRDGRRWRKASGRVRMIVSGERLGLYRGDEVRVFGTLQKPAGQENPGGFDAANYHRSRRILALLQAEHPDCVTLLRSSSRWHAGRLRQRVRQSAHAILRRHLAPSCEALAGAMLLGYREEVDPSRYQSMRETGTLHLLAISGMHVGLVALGFYGLLAIFFLPRKVLAIALAAMVLAYLQLTDARPSAIRATILVLVFCAGLYFGRKPWTIHSLALAAVLVLAGNPCDLFLPGTQLSFLAASTLTWIPLLPTSGRSWRTVGRAGEKGAEASAWRSLGGLLRLPGRLMGRHFLVSTTIWLVALPLVTSCFHLVTPVAMFVNPLIWLPLTLAMMSGFAVMIVGFFWAAPAEVFAIGCEQSLKLLQWMLDLFHAFPGGHFFVPGPAVWWIIAFYSAYFLWTLFPELRPRARRLPVLLVGWIVVGLLVALTADAQKRHRAAMEVEVLSMGHGLCVVMHLPDGRTILYDAGSFASPRSGAEKIGRALWCKGVTHLDAIVLSHADADHYSHVPALMERFSVGCVYVSPFMFERASIYTSLEKLRETVTEAGIPLRRMTAGFRFQGIKGLVVECMHPTREGEFGEDNTNSIVLGVSYRGWRILLPGDLEGQGREALFMEEPWDCDVLLAPHHGSGNSEPGRWLTWCRPEAVLISGSRWQRNTEVVSRFGSDGAAVWETFRHGAISVVLGKSELRIDSFAGNRTMTVPGVRP